jgi:hypothetical protein
MLSDFSYEVTKRTIQSFPDTPENMALKQLALTLLDSNKHQTELINMWIYGNEFKNLESRRGK